MAADLDPAATATQQPPAWCDDCGRHGCVYPARAAHRPRRRWRLFGRGRRD